MKFEELNLTDELLDCIRKEGFTEPTLIQEKTIPHILEGKDVIAESATGSGKTLAFGAGIIPNLKKGKGIQALVLTPTRELAEQVKNSLELYSKNQLKVTAIYGGVSMEPQYHNLRKSDIVVGTPGRILDHLQRKTIDLSKITHMVLDEADRMLDMGFLEDVEKIMSQCPNEKQSMFFSATIPPEIMKLSKRFMKDYELVRVENYVDPKKLTQVYYDVQSGLKFSLLAHLIEQEDEGLVMVFCNSRRSVDFVSDGLMQAGIDALGIHGGLTQQRRSHIMEKFNSKDKLVLVCTDVAARGLDIPNVSHVYNYDIPNDTKQYIHRIGRTARAGKSGKAINLLSDRDHDNFNKVLGEFDVEITKAEKPFVEKINFTQKKGPMGGQSGGRPRRGSGPRQNSRGNFGRRENSGRPGPRQGGRSSSNNSSAGRASQGPRRSNSGPNGRRREGSFNSKPADSRSGGKKRGFHGPKKPSGRPNGTKPTGTKSKGNSPKKRPNQ